MLLSQLVARTSVTCCKHTVFSTNFIRNKTYSCKLLIVGGGSGGMSMAAKFAKILRNKEIIVLEPSSLHYYQPLFTLIGAGVKNFNESHKLTKELLPPEVNWIQDEASEFEPTVNAVKTAGGSTINYKFMLVAMGLQLNYHLIKGVEEALSDPNSGVCSIYSPQYVLNTYPALQNFRAGNAIFTFPNSPVKCPGAPQKICYLAEHYFRNTGKRDSANIIYNTSLPVIFGVEAYAKALWLVAKERNITVNIQRNLIEIRPHTKEAIFEDLSVKGSTYIEKYSFLHVTPPQGTPDALKHCSDLVNVAGFLDVDKSTLRHTKFSNIFGIGDCTNSPNSKTVAAIAAQSGVVFEHLRNALEGKGIGQKMYDGYASCPLVTGYGSCILAEFDYNLQPKETFPIDQSNESWLMYQLKKEVLPPLYWKLMLTGRWNGPGVYRKILHLGLK